MIFFIPIKQNSQRVPKKNFRTFGKVELYKHTLYKLFEHKVYVDTDSDEIIRQCKEDNRLKHVTAFRREEKLKGDKVSVCDLISSFIKRYEIQEPIVQIHVTSPFLNKNTLADAYKMIGEHDSIVSCNKIQSRLWRKEKYGYCPVNHNPVKMEQTQDLPPLYEENSAFYIFKPEVPLCYNSRIGTKPYFFPLEFPENLDIDTEDDWEKCFFVNEKYQK
jgi:CMP-N-acetylneuraminic acid synthetase